MTSYFNACDATVANSNRKNFLTCTCVPHFGKGSATHGYYDVPLGRCWGTNNTRKRIRL